MSIVNVDVSQSDPVIARLANLPEALHASLGRAFASISDALYARVIAKLDGEVVSAGTGRLQAAITQASDDLSARVALDTDAAPYGAALEFGASIPAQLIAVKNARSLAFTVGSQQIFANRVMRPAFALPAHSFLRSSLDEMAPDIFAQLDDAVSEAVSP